MDLPTFTNADGRLSVVEGCEDVNFAIERIYYLYDVPATVTRGAHGHRELVGSQNPDSAGELLVCQR